MVKELLNPIFKAVMSQPSSIWRTQSAWGLSKEGRVCDWELAPTSWASTGKVLNLQALWFPLKSLNTISTCLEFCPRYTNAAPDGSHSRALWVQPTQHWMAVCGRWTLQHGLSLGSGLPTPILQPLPLSTLHAAPRELHKNQSWAGEPWFTHCCDSLLL